jgi:hypothetical protein
MYTTLKIQKLAFFFFSSVRLQMYSIKSKKVPKRKEKKPGFRGEITMFWATQGHPTFP